MAIKVTDEMIRQLTQEWAESLPDQYPKPPRPHRFSLRFHWKMRSILRRAKRQETAPAPFRGGRLAEDAAPPPLFRAGRFAAALLTAALLTATVAMAFPTARERVFQMVREIQGEYTRIYYEMVAGEDSAEDWGFTLYRFSYLPEGFSLEEYSAFDIFHHEVFVNEEGLRISLDQDRLDGAFAFSYTGTEEPEEILLSGDCPAWYVDREGLQSIYWDDGVYSFHLATNLSRKETVKLAESLVPVEDPFADVQFTPYQAAWLPDGFSAAEERTERGAHHLRYEGPDGSSLVLDQIWVEWEAFAEDFKKVRPEEPFLLQGQQAKLLERPDHRALYWNYGEYSFRLSSDALSREELTKAAVNLHPAGKEAEVLSPYRLTYIPAGFVSSGNGYGQGAHYEDFYEYDLNAEYGGVYKEDVRKIDFHQERLGKARHAIDTQGLNPTAFTLGGGRTVWVLANPPKERTLWTQYSYALWWEDGEYLLSLWSSLPWEETVKIAEGILKM